MWLPAASGTAESRKVLALAITLSPRALLKPLPLSLARAGSRRCRRTHRRGCPSARWRRSVHSAHWSAARPAAARRSCRSPHRHWRFRPVLGRGLRQQIADLLQEGGVGVEVDRLALVGAMPAVDLGLQACRERRAARDFSARDPPTMAASPAQNASGVIPVFGLASLAMKSNRTGAIFNPWASMRFMMEFSHEKRAVKRGFQELQGKKGAVGRGVGAPFSAKAGPQEKPFNAPIKAAVVGDSDIGRQINHFVEQDAAPAQHPLDLLGRFADGARRSVERRARSTAAAGNRCRCL